jgi:hypothetical protein
MFKTIRIGAGRRRLLSLALGLALLCAHGREAVADPSAGDVRAGKDLSISRSAGDVTRETDQRASGRTSDGGLPEVGNAIPEMENEVSMAGALTADFLIPGGGSLYYKNYYYGAAFAVSKFVALYAVYYFYQEWEYRGSLYHSAKNANESIDPDHELEFKVPGEGYKTESEMKRDYDRAAQNITFSVLATAAVYALSLVVTYTEVKKINERAIPAFEISWRCDTVEQGGSLFLGYSVRI